MVLAISIVIVVKIRKDRAQKDLESEKLKKDFVHWKIFNVAIKNIFGSIFIRGGEGTVKIIDEAFIEVRNENSIVAKGVQFLDNECLRKLFSVHYPDKIKTGIRYITRAALCHFALEVGLGILGAKVVKVSSWLTL